MTFFALQLLLLKYWRVLYWFCVLICRPDICWQVFLLMYLDSIINVVFSCCLCCWIADKSLIVWRLTRDESSYGMPQKSLHGHGHFVSDVILSSDGQFALSGSWDHTLRLWDLSRYIVLVWLLANYFSGQVRHRHWLACIYLSYCYLRAS